MEDFSLIPQTKKDEKNIKVVINKSNSIEIPKPLNTEMDLNEEYSLDLINFNPSKLSPPNFWKYRLESRLKQHCSNSSLFN